MKRFKIHVTGKVQGVFFRDTARRQAEALGLSGFARNEPDGSVYIEVDGSPPALVEFLSWTCIGPPQAQVDDVTYTEHDNPACYTGFEIR